MKGNRLTQVYRGMKYYDIILQNGHILIEAENGGTLLIDTGSPMSFHRAGSFVLDGQSFSVPTSLMGVDAQYVSDNVGTRVDGLIGMNVIGRLGMAVDIPSGRLTFGASTEGWSRIPSSSTFGVVGIAVTVGGRAAKVALDTGAPISYIGREYTDGYPSVGTVTDFSPFSGAGSFEATLHEIPVTVGGERYTMRLGVPPTDVAMMISGCGLDGAIGLELLGRKAVLIADGGVWLKPQDA